MPEPQKKRKIVYYYLSLTMGDLGLNESFKRTIDFINNLSKEDREQNITNKKFGLLDRANFNSDSTVCELLFKSASHSFRPPLIKRGTASERENPKDMDEGETKKTHIISKAIGGDVIFAAEKYLDCLSINQIINYLNRYASRLEVENKIKFSAEIIAKDDIFEIIDSMERVIKTYIYTNKDILGSDYLNFTGDMSPLKNEIKMELTSKKRRSIEQLLRDSISKKRSGQGHIHRIRVEGKDENNNLIKFNTDSAEKQEYIWVDSNNTTGEVATRDIFDKIQSILYNSYN